MKKYFIWLLFLFLCQELIAQEPLDTVFISNKKAVRSLTKIRYYYYPNLQAYFDTKTSLYVYKKKERWIEINSIPPNFRGYSLNNGYSVVIKGYVGDKLDSIFQLHKQKYPADYSSRRKKARVIVLTK